MRKPALLATAITALLAMAVTVTVLTLGTTTVDATITSVFDGTVSCSTRGSGAHEGQVWCGTGGYRPITDTRSTVKSFDDVPIDVNAAFPDAAEFGKGPYPLVYMLHVYGSGKEGFPEMDRWLRKGYAVFSQTNRGFFESCGSRNAINADPVCRTRGFIRLDDSRFEVRDAQLFAGMLVDEGLVNPNRIAATGSSYGGGMSMSLAALKDRIMLLDGSYAPWTSPDGIPMSLAVAVPNIPFTDFAYSLVPNGSNIDYIRDASYHGRFGVMKPVFVNAIYLSGTAIGQYSPAGRVPSADLAGWLEFMSGGEPYDGRPEARAMLTELTRFHSSYYLDHSQVPAPLLISSGFTDDLVPASEATRFYNRTVAQYPNADIGLFFGSFGHARGQNRPEVIEALEDRENQWVDYYLTGAGRKPPSDVTTYTQTCPDSEPAGGPYVTADWADQSLGEIRMVDRGAARTVSPDGGDRAVGAAFDPIPTGQACAEAPGVKEPGTANYELAPAPAGGYTVMGSPTFIARIRQAGDSSQVASRLVDVAPDGSTKTLVSRAIWRPAATRGFQVFQLNPNGWHVDEGHVLRLELLPFDGSDDSGSSSFDNYSRPSNGQQPARIKDVDLRIPVRETPGSLNGLVTRPAPKVLPNRPDVTLAPGLEAIGSQTIAGYTVRKTEPAAGPLP